jgi:hypothetical protein
MLEIWSESTILADMKEELLKLCEFKWHQEFELLYRGSLHGFRVDDFHSRCDNIPKTVTLVKAAESGCIFGGYTQTTWDKSYKVKTDKNAFIFSLVNKENKPVKVNVAKGKEDLAIWNIDGPCFGINDLSISLPLFKDSKDSITGYSRFGFAYVLPNYPLGSEQAKNFIAGSETFKIEDIEVFQLK